MRRNPRWLIVLALVLTVATLVSATGQVENDSSEVEDEYVKLELLTFGDKAADADSVLEELNSRLMDRMNTEVEVEFLTWANWKSKYNLLLSSGERIDLSYAARWADFFPNASKGAFLELEALIPEHAPQIWADMEPTMWTEVTLNGHIYAIPNQWQKPQGWGMCYREDLRAQYDLPVPDSLEEMQAYWQGIKDNEPDLFPVGNPDGEVFSLFSHTRPNASAVPGSRLIYYRYDEPTEISSILDFEPELVEFLRLVKTWADAGYWSANSLSDRTQSMDALKNGRLASAINSNKGKTRDFAVELDSRDSDWKVGLVPMSDISGFEFNQPATSSMMVLPISSRYPERSIQLVEILQNSADLQHLTIYGIEDKHYALTDQGRIDYTGFDPEVVGFTIGSMWPNGWINGKYMFTPVNEWDKLAAIEARLDDRIVPDPYASFFFDATEVSSEMAAVEQATIQYLYPLFTGLVDDVEAGWEEAKAALDAAGFGRLVESHRAQMMEHLRVSGQL